MLTSIIPFVLACGLVGLILSSVLVRRGEPRMRLFADAVVTGAGSVLGIWLGLALIGLILGLVTGAIVSGCVFLCARVMEHVTGVPFPLKSALAGLFGFIAGTRVMWRFASLGFLRR